MRNQVLTGCNHSGLVEVGRAPFFDKMDDTSASARTKRIILARSDRYVMARGMLFEAEELLRQMMKNDESAVMWSSLLRSCRVYGDDMVDGRRAAEKQLEVDPEDPDLARQVPNFYFEIWG